MPKGMCRPAAVQQLLNRVICQGDIAMETVMYLLKNKQYCEYTDNLISRAKLIDNLRRVSYHTINKGTQEQHK